MLNEYENGMPLVAIKTLPLGSLYYTFVPISDIKKQVLLFYLGMGIKGRKKIADKALSKMGRKKLSVWMKL